MERRSSNSEPNDAGPENLPVVDNDLESALRRRHQQVHYAITPEYMQVVVTLPRGRNVPLAGNHRTAPPGYTLTIPRSMAAQLSRDAIADLLQQLESSLEPRGGEQISASVESPGDQSLWTLTTEHANGKIQQATYSIGPDGRWANVPQDGEAWVVIEEGKAEQEALAPADTEQEETRPHDVLPDMAPSPSPEWESALVLDEFPLPEEEPEEVPGAAPEVSGARVEKPAARRRPVQSRRLLIAGLIAIPALVLVAALSRLLLAAPSPSATEPPPSAHPTSTVRMTQAASVAQPTQIPTPSEAPATEDQGAAPEEGAQPDTAGEETGQQLGIITYVVQEADTLPGIAERWGLDPLSILWCNEKTLPTVHMLHPGLELFIPPEDGACVITSGERTLEQIAQAYGVSAHDIIDFPHNELYGMVPDDRPEADILIFIPGGVGRDQESYWMPTETTNPECGNRVVNYAPGHPGSCGEVEFPKELAVAGEWVSPLYFYSHISRRYSDWHPGTDIVSSAGTPIFAADSGVVVFSGWHNWGYGNLVVIDHGNNWATLYAHLSLIYVGCGEIVSQGDVIGTLGNTGNSSGPHLHYEMHLRGRALDPQIHGGL
jgi:hypothetical protein